MADNDLSIFEDETSEAEPVLEQEQPETVEDVPQEEPQATEDTGELDATPPVAAPEEEPRNVPLVTMLDEREKRQEAQRQLEAAQQEQQKLEAQLRQLKEPKPAAPDWFEDPTAAAQHQVQTFEQRMQQQALAQSKFFAEREFGAELINETVAFFDQNPALSTQFLSEPSPFHAAVEFYKGQKAVQEIGSDPEAWRAAERERIRQEVQAEMQQQAPAQTPPRPPSSISSAPAGGNPNVKSVNAPPNLGSLFTG